ncbi:hypothetical protein ACB094_01G269800 [Castanea mollissima]
MWFFPFMSKGHTIPILHLARLLLHRSLTVTIFTTPANRPFIFESLNDTTVTILDLPFLHNVPDIPVGIESTDKLPSMSMFHAFGNATKHMQPDFERAIQTLPRISFIVSDGFLWWTLESASKFNIPRFVFCGMNYYSTSVVRAVDQDRLLFGPESDNELITVTHFPWIKVSRNDFVPPFTESEPKGLIYEFIMNVIVAETNSYGIIVNSFYELESVFAEYWNRECQPKPWSVGPLCQAEPPKARNEPHNNKPKWVQWLDKKFDQGNSVLYIAFGSQVVISLAQLKEIAIGLEESKMNFLWVIRKSESEISDGFEERVKDRGIVVREWVDQREILMHKSVQEFLSHCGWNSALESICAAVPILAWPMMAEQPLNARMVVEEIKVGLRVETCDGSVRGFVKWEGLEKMVKELMEGKKGKEVRKKCMEVTEKAKKAMEESGSSKCTLDLLIDETCGKTT